MGIFDNAEVKILNVEKVDANTSKILSSWDSNNIGKIVSDLPVQNTKKGISKLVGQASDYVKSVAKSIAKFRI